MSTDVIFRVDFFWMRHHWISEIYCTVWWRVYITIYDLHVINKVGFEMLHFKKIGKEVIYFLCAFMIFEQVEPHRNEKTRMEFTTDIFSDECFKTELISSEFADFICKLKLQQTIKCHNKFFLVEELGKFIIIYGDKLWVEMMKFLFPAHVANSISNGSGIFLRDLRVIVFPSWLDTINNCFHKFFVLIEGPLGGLL